MQFVLAALAYSLQSAVKRDAVFWEQLDRGPGGRSGGRGRLPAPLSGCRFAEGYRMAGSNGANPITRADAEVTAKTNATGTCWHARVPPPPSRVS